VTRHDRLCPGLGWVGTLSRPTGASRALTLALLLGVSVGGCQRVGVISPPVPAPSLPSEGVGVVPLASDRDATLGRLEGPSAQGVTLAPTDLNRVTDAILHSPSTRDSWVEERAGYWVEFWTTRASGTFTRYLERMGSWEAFVEAELIERGLPVSLKYLPIVESGYYEIAVSGAGATGLWQIMAPTGRQLGLSITPFVDDRRDPVASTRAALDYLTELNRMFGSWFLTLAAYNAGPGRIQGLIQRHMPGADLTDDAVYTALRPHLPAETRDFVPRFLAAAILGEDPEAFGFQRPSAAQALAWDEVVVLDATSLDVVALAAGVDEASVRRLNPQFLRGFTPAGEARPIRVPAGGAALFDVRYPMVPPSDRVSFMEHSVARGETLAAIASRYRVPLVDLQAANRDVDPRRLQIGQRLVVPVSGAGGSLDRLVALWSAEEMAPTTSGVGVEIATGANGVNGAVAAVPATSGNGGAAALNGSGATSGAATMSGEAATAVTPPRVHEVMPGDTWFSLARRFGVTADALAALNGTVASEVLRVGQRLRLPDIRPN
jgi:membrane-bound lytic murein transglycosylase D